MKKQLAFLLILTCILVLIPTNTTNAQTISERLKGRLLLQVEQGGAIWYVDTNDLHRYSVTWANALPLFEKLSLGITDHNLNQIPVVGNKQTGNVSMRNRLKGKLLLQVEQRGAIWYVDKDGYRHSVTWTNLMPLFQSLALGITNADLNKIPIGEFTNTTNSGNDETNPNERNNNTYQNTEKIKDPAVTRNDLRGSKKGLVKNYTFTYDWNDKNQGKEINISVDVPQELYDHYIYQQAHIFAPDFSNLPNFVTYDDEVIKDVANQIYQIYKNTGMNPIVIAQLLVDEIVYTDDINTGYNEYPKYPVETLVDGEGDCEDTSFLLASLLKFSGLNFDFNPILVEFKNHLGIAVVVPNDVYGDYINSGMVDYMEINSSLKNNKLLYIETTGQKWKVGTMPTSLIGQKQTIRLIK